MEFCLLNVVVMFHNFRDVLGQAPVFGEDFPRVAMGEAQRGALSLMERNLFGPRQLSRGAELLLERHHIDQFAQIVQQPCQIGALRFLVASFAGAETADQPTTQGMLPEDQRVNDPVRLWARD